VALLSSVDVFTSDSLILGRRPRFLGCLD
jgi:hypothetical protein